MPWKAVMRLTEPRCEKSETDASELVQPPGAPVVADDAKTPIYSADLHIRTSPTQALAKLRY